MKKFTYQYEKTELINLLNTKAKKKHLNIIQNQDKIQISLNTQDFKNGEADIPVSFRGRISENDGMTILKGRFVFGLYLYILVIAAIMLVAARFVWSAYQKQTDNMILCGIVSIVLIVVVLIVSRKSKAAREIISQFLREL